MVNLLVVEQKRMRGEKNIESGDVIVNFDVKSEVIQASGEVQQLKLINETVIDFKNTETNSFYSKNLKFYNPLNVGVSFQLYIAPEHIQSAQNYFSQQNTSVLFDLNWNYIFFSNSQSQFQEASEFTFCVPLNLLKLSAIKEIYDKLSNFYFNPFLETSTEIQDPESLKRISIHPDFEQEQRKIMDMLEGLKQYTRWDEQRSDSMNNLSQERQAETFGGYTCKKGLLATKIKKYLENQEFSRELMEFYREPEKHFVRMNEWLLQVETLKGEIIAITKATRKRPNLHNYGMRIERGLWDKIKHFFLATLWPSTGGVYSDYSVTEWQNQVYNLNLGLDQNKINDGNVLPNNNGQQKRVNITEQTGFTDILHSQQFYLGSDVINKTITLFPKQTLQLNALIYIPKYEEARNNLIIKSNVSEIEIVPIKGRSGVGRIKLMSVNTLSPFLMPRKDAAYSYHVQQIQKYLDQNIFIFSITTEELDKSLRNNVDILKIYRIKNVGEFPISVKNIYIESQPCQAYGFFIVGCSCQFKLEPNQEKTITIGYQSDYPEDTIERNIYLYTQTYHLGFKIRAQFSHTKNILPQSDVNEGENKAAIGETRGVDVEKKVVVEEIRNFDGYGQSKNDSQRSFGDERIQIYEGEEALSQQVILPNNNLIVQNRDVSLKEADIIKTLVGRRGNKTSNEDISLANESGLEARKLFEILEQVDKEDESNKLEDTWSKSIGMKLNQKSNRLLEQLRPFLILGMVLMTGVFFMHIFVSYLYSDLLRLYKKRHKLRIGVNLLNKESQIEYIPEKTLVDYDIPFFLKKNTLDPSILALKSTLQRIKENQEKAQQQMRLNKQTQIHLKRSSEIVLQDIKIPQVQQNNDSEVVNERKGKEQHDNVNKLDEGYDYEYEDQDDYDEEYEIDKGDAKQYDEQLECDSNDDVNADEQYHTYNYQENSSNSNQKIISREQNSLQQINKETYKSFEKKSVVPEKQKQIQQQVKDEQYNSAKTKNKSAQLSVSTQQQQQPSNSFQNQYARVNQIAINLVPSTQSQQIHGYASIEQEIEQKKSRLHTIKDQHTQQLPLQQVELQMQKNETLKLNDKKEICSSSEEIREVKMNVIEDPYNQLVRQMNPDNFFAYEFHETDTYPSIMHHIQQTNEKRSQINQQTNEKRSQINQQTNEKRSQINQQTNEKRSQMNQQINEKWSQINEKRSQITQHIQLNQNKEVQNTQPPNPQEQQQSLAQNLQTSQQQVYSKTINQQYQPQKQQNIPQQQPSSQIQKRQFLVQDNASSCGEDEDDREKIHLSPQTSWKNKHSLKGVSEEIVDSIYTSLTEQKQIKEIHQDVEETNKTKEKDGKDKQEKDDDEEGKKSESSQLSSGDSLSSEDIDNFKRSNDSIKAIGQSRQIGQVFSFQVGDEENSQNSSSTPNSGMNSLRSSYKLERTLPQDATQMDSHQDKSNKFFNYQYESSDDDLKPIQQRKYFNVFNPQPCYYPINLLNQPTSNGYSIDSQLERNEFEQEDNTPYPNLQQFRSINFIPSTLNNSNMMMLNQSLFPSTPIALRQMTSLNQVQPSRLEGDLFQDNLHNIYQNQTNNNITYSSHKYDNNNNNNMFNYNSPNNQFISSNLHNNTLNSQVMQQSHKNKKKNITNNNPYQSQNNYQYGQYTQMSGQSEQVRQMRQGNSFNFPHLNVQKGVQSTKTGSKMHLKPSPLNKNSDFNEQHTPIGSSLPNNKILGYTPPQKCKIPQLGPPGMGNIDERNNKTLTFQHPEYVMQFDLKFEASIPLKPPNNQNTIN